MTTHSSGRPHGQGAARSLRGTLASLRTRVTRAGSKPMTRVLLLVAGLAVLAIVGRIAGARAELSAPAQADPTPDAGSGLPIALAAAAVAPGEPSPLAAAVPCDGAAGGAGASTRQSRRDAATPEDPVFLNAAAVGDLRRLPGVGAKRADAIVALRTRLGRFRQLEDLLRVRGIGRATLRRLRPLVRLDPRPGEPRAEGAQPAQTSPPTSPPPP